MRSETSMTRKSIPLDYQLLFFLFCPPLICFSFGFPHAAVLSIFLTVICLWVTEALPLAVTGLLVPVLAVIYGAMPASSAFDAFGSDILFLFLGCFLMGRSMEKHRFDKRLAYFLLGRCMPGNSFFSINLVVALASFSLSMWISNTSATAIMCAVALGIISSLEREIEDPVTKNAISVRLLLSIAFAASIGGLATPVGSPPNLIALKLLSQHGISISFTDWLLIGFPISLVMLVVMFLIFHLVFPLRKLRFPKLKEQFNESLAALGPLKSGELQIALIFLGVIALWIFPPLFSAIFPEDKIFILLNDRLSMSVVGMLGGLITFFLPVHDGELDKRNLHWSETGDLEWGTLMLFGGGLTLGLLLEKSGAAKDISSYLFSTGTGSLLLLGVGLVIVAISLSEFASNTAAAAILIPLILGATSDQGLSSEVTLSLVLAATFAASFGFMLPVSTPPNAIVYGTGKVPAKAMRKIGLCFDIAGGLVIVVYFLGKLFFTGINH